MGEDRFEYGTLNDLAYTSRNGHPRGIPGGQTNRAERIQISATKARKRPKQQQKKVRQLALWEIEDGSKVILGR